MLLCYCNGCDGAELRTSCIPKHYVEIMRLGKLITKQANNGQAPSELQI